MSLKYNFFPVYLILLSIFGYKMESKFQTYTNYNNHDKYKWFLWPPMFVGVWFLKDKVIKKESLKYAYSISVIGLAFEFITRLKIVHNISAIFLLLLLSYKFVKIKDQTPLQKVLTGNIIISNITGILNAFISKYITQKISDKLDDEAIIGISEQVMLLSIAIFNVVLTEDQYRSPNNIKDRTINILGIREEMIIYITTIINIIGTKNIKKILRNIK